MSAGSLMDPSQRLEQNRPSHRRNPTIEDRGWVVKEGVVGAKEQVGTVAPSAQIEEELPGALRHLGSISRLEAAPLGQGL